MVLDGLKSASPADCRYRSVCRTGPPTPCVLYIYIYKQTVRIIHVAQEKGVAMREIKKKNDIPSTSFVNYWVITIYNYETLSMEIGV